MRYVFIVNPSAGKTNPYNTVFPVIQNYFKANGMDLVCHVTDYPKHATELAKQQGAKGDAVRIFAIGGDGTLSEVAAGVIGMDNVEVGIIPCGSGNDFVRTFGKIENFLSIEKQLAAKSRKVDMIESQDHIAINLCSLGMDARVAYEMVKFKTLPFFTGSMAYNTALVKVLLGKIGEHLKVEIDGTKKYEGDYLFALAGSGRYYGSGYCGAPKAVPDDGLLDFILIKKPPFSRIPSLVKIYKEGGHIDSPKFKGLLTYCRGTEMRVSSLKPVIANYDGEVCPTQQEYFKVIPRAVNFIVPE
jgi:diacylglycerol kinase (ATP)